MADGNDYELALDGTVATPAQAKPSVMKCGRCKAAVPEQHIVKFQEDGKIKNTVCHGCIAFMILNFDVLAARIDRLEKLVTSTAKPGEFPC